ncbi:MAG TPA: YqzL family protein [Pseudogracilibacillus sp.]|nr:YqzL family protein [Pseudogracilibacillus sp.]
MDDRMWNVFLQTGNIEAYLLVKQLEQEKQEEESLQQSVYEQEELND